jgi:putative peptidoglycan lipid II flippase
MVNKLIKNGTNLMFQRQTTIMSAAGVLMVMSVGSALLGLYRLHLLSGLATSTHNLDLLDAFKAAFRLPDLVYNILITGALNAAFIPVFGDLVAKHKQEDAWRVASALINIVLLLFAVVGVFVFIFAEPFVHIIAPLFTDEKLRVTAQLTRVMMLSPILLGASAFLSGGINVYHRFIVPALAPILYNVGAIVGILLLYPHFGVYGLAYGILLGAGLHLLIQIPLAYKLGFRYHFGFCWGESPVRRVAKLMLPRTVGLGIDQIESLVATILSSTLGSGAYFLFTQTFNLVTFPISFFGVSMAQAALPTLTREAAQDQRDNFRQTLLYTFHQVLYLTVPVAVLMIVLKLPITRIIQNFPNWVDTLVSAHVMFYFALGLAAQAGIHVFVRGLYALEDTVSPLYAGSAGVIVSVLTSLLTIQAYGLRGIALGISVGSAVNLILLIVFMQKKIGGLGWSNFWVPIMRIFVSGAIMATAVYVPVKPMERVLFDTSRTFDLIMLSVLVSGFGLSLYLFVTWVMGSEEIVLFLKIANKLRSWREAFMKFPTSEESTTTMSQSDVSTGS